MKCLIFVLLFLAFFLLFHETEITEYTRRLIRRKQLDLDAATRNRILDDRRRLATLQEENTFLGRIEKKLRYSGLKAKFPGITVEKWLVGNVIFLSATFVLGLWMEGIWLGGLCAGALVFLEELFLDIGRMGNKKKVNEDLLKLLDFLGNYSMSSLDVVSVLGQVSKYMENPIKEALDRCYYEAEVTGDINLALLSMAEAVEHPKFRELARNLEVSVRYCTDLSAVVNSSRRSMREYLRSIQQRKGLLGEAMFNMVLLLLMSLIIFGVVSTMIQVSVAELIWGSVPGKIGTCVIVFIIFLYLGQIKKLQS